MSAALFTWDEITKEQIDQVEIVQIDVIPQYIFTYNKALDQCDIWVSNGIMDFAHSMYQWVNLLPLEGMSWEEFKNTELRDYGRTLYAGIMRNNLPEELLFKV